MRLRHLLVGTAVVLWTVIVISAYYIVHRPLPHGSPPNAILAIGDFVVAFVLTSLAGGIGMRLLGRIELGSRIEGAVVQLGIGVGVLGLAVFGLGLVSLLNRWVIWLVVVTGSIVLRKSILRWYQNIADLKHQYLQAGSFGKILAWSFAVMVIMSLLLSLTPPQKWDSLVYHLELPKQYLQTGKLVYLPDNQFVGSPQLVELNFTAAMAMRGGTSAGVFGWIVGVIALIGVGGFARRLIGPRAIFLAPMILLSGESIAEGLSWAYVDLWLLLFSVSTLITLDLFTRTRDRKLLIIAAICAGFAAGVKYTGAQVILLSIVWLSFDEIRRFWQIRRGSENTNRSEISISLNRNGGSIRTYLKTVLLFVIIALVVLSPWLLKNYLFTKNPFYPFFFEGGAVDSLRQSFYYGPNPQRNLIDDLVLPWEATILGVEDTPGYSSSIGPLMLVFIPILILTNWLKKARKYNHLYNISIIALLGWLGWAIGTHFSNFLSSPRLYYGFFPAFAVLASAGFLYISDIEIPRVRIHIVIQALVLLTIALSLISMAFLVIQRNPVPIVFGFQSRDDYLFQRLGWFQAAMKEINSLPTTSKTLFLWESRAYYCENACSPDVVIDRWWYLSRSLGDHDQIADWMKQEEVTHVLIYDTGKKFIQSQENLFEDKDWLLLDRFTEKKLTKVSEIGGTYSLYSLGSD
jgi:hypothetical protein